MDMEQKRRVSCSMSNSTRDEVYVMYLMVVVELREDRGGYNVYIWMFG